MFVLLMKLQTTETKLEKQGQGAMFPVKKRAYNDSDPAQMNRYDSLQTQEYSRDAELNLMVGRQVNMATNQVEEPAKQYVQSIPEQKQQVPNNVQSMENREQYPTTGNTDFNATYGGESYNLNVPSTRQDVDRKIDMSKYTNMGYTGPDANFSRNSPQFTNFVRTASEQQQQQQQQQHQQQQVNAASDMNMAMRYSNTSGDASCFYCKIDDF